MHILLKIHICRELKESQCCKLQYWFNSKTLLRLGYRIISIRLRQDHKWKAILQRGNASYCTRPLIVHIIVLGKWLKPMRLADRHKLGLKWKSSARESTQQAGKLLSISSQCSGCSQASRWIWDGSSWHLLFSQFVAITWCCWGL